MVTSASRRRFLGWLSAGVPAVVVAARHPLLAQGGPPPVRFPAQPAEVVQEMVVASHIDLARVKALVGRQPALAKAAWDWGYGDWETALGAASHIGNRDVAAVLLANGAHPTIFSAAMLGQLDIVKGFIAASPGIQRTIGPHSITLLSHAKAGGAGAKAVVEYLQTVDGADERPAVQPLTEEEAAALAGTYTFGRTPADQLVVTVTKAQLQIARPGQYARGLFHLGKFEFCPVGAESVRIKFAKQPDGMALTVHDPDVVLTARRV